MFTEFFKKFGRFNLFVLLLVWSFSFLIKEAQAQSNSFNYGDISGSITPITRGFDGNLSSGNSDASGRNVSNLGDVVFISEATNLVSGGTTSRRFFWFNHQSSAVEVLPAFENNTQTDIQITPDGHWITARQVSGHLYIFDTQQKTYEEMTTTTATPIIISRWQMSSNGEYIAFETTQTFSSLDTNANLDVYRWERKSRSIDLVSLSNKGDAGMAFTPSISSDGQLISFTGDASSYGSGKCGNNSADIFLRTMATTEVVCVTAIMTEYQNNEKYQDFQMSDDANIFYFEGSALTGSNWLPTTTYLLNRSAATYIVFEKYSYNGAALALNQDGSFILFQRQTTTTYKYNVCLFLIADENGECYRLPYGNGGTTAVTIMSASASGRFVVLSSPDQAVVGATGYLSGHSDLFLWDRTAVGYSIAGKAPATNTYVMLKNGERYPTASDGGYIIPYLKSGQYQLTPKGAASFYPSTQTISVGPSRLGVNFKPYSAVPPVLRFPLDHPDQSEVAALQSRVNSWFDHTTPQYGSDTQKSVMTRYDGLTGFYYDGHDGIDFSRLDYKNDSDEAVYSAAAGTVYKVVTTCVVKDTKCGAGLGNQVWINHGNGYVTIYGHLKSIVVSEGETVINHQTIGFMGNTGNAAGKHLHFGLAFNPNSTWVTGGAITDVLDPYGWSGSGVDPWQNTVGTKSMYVWQQSNSVQAIICQTGFDQIHSPSGLFIAGCPTQNPVGSMAIQISDFPAFSWNDLLHSVGLSFQVLGAGKPQVVAAQVNGNLTQTLQISMTYVMTEVRHLDTNKMAIFWSANPSSGSWQQLSSTQSLNNTVTAELQNTGYVELAAPLLCATDTAEIDDNIDRAKVLQVGETAIRVFDSTDDEDWITFQPITGTIYTLEVTTTSGVKVNATVYDWDGETVMQQFSNSLQWQAPTANYYYLRLQPEHDSKIGCDAQLSVTVIKKGGAENPTPTFTPTSTTTTVPDGSTPTPVVTNTPDLNATATPIPSTTPQSGSGKSSVFLPLVNR